MRLSKCPDEIAVMVSQRAAELPRRTTSEDWPHILLVTIEELQFIVTDEINKALQPRDEAPPHHYFTPDPTKRFCTICGDNALGSVWGIHRFQIQPGDPAFTCACGHQGRDHAQFRYSCFVKDCACEAVHGRVRR